MENFEEMLEQYLDNDEMNSKYVNDQKEIIKEKKNNSKRTVNNFDGTITISQFVSYYLGTNHKCKNLKHKGLKSFNNPYVVGISNEFATKNPDCIIRNEIIVVIDDYGNPGTYINPNILKQITTMEKYINTRNLLEKVRLHDLNSIDKLYNEYRNVINNIQELQKVYIDSCDLLRCLEKRYILEEICKYIKKANNLNLKCVTQQKEVQDNITLQFDLLTDFEKNTEEKEIVFEDDIEQIDCKINRQKAFVQHNKRGTIKKGN